MLYFGYFLPGYSVFLYINKTNIVSNFFQKQCYVLVFPKTILCYVSFIFLETVLVFTQRSKLFMDSNHNKSYCFMEKWQNNHTMFFLKMFNFKNGMRIYNLSRIRLLPLFCRFVPTKVLVRFAHLFLLLVLTEVVVSFSLLLLWFVHKEVLVRFPHIFR